MRGGVSGQYTAMAHLRMSDSLTGGDRRAEPQTPLRSNISGVTRVWSSGSDVVTDPPARTVDGMRTGSFQHPEPGRRLSSSRATPTPADGGGPAPHHLGRSTGPSDSAASHTHGPARAARFQLWKKPVWRSVATMSRE